MIRTFFANKLQVNIYITRQEMGSAAAEAAAAEIRELMGRKEQINIIFAAAPSQQEMLESFRDQQIDWSRVNAFHMDEYVGLADEAPQRFGNFLKEIIFRHLPFKSVHYINGNAADVQAECERYAALLTEYPADIVLLGIGENGHLAFNDPPVADFSDPLLVKMVELDVVCRNQQVNDGCFSSFGEVPSHAITLTIPALLSGKSLYASVPGKTKIEAVYNTMNQEITSAYPSTILRTHDRATLYLDEVSASTLSN
jgi:glucosamine-6-phosphate deaminase